MNLSVPLRIGAFLFGLLLPIVKAPSALIGWVVGLSFLLVIVLVHRGTRGALLNPAKLYSLEGRSIRLEAGPIESNLLICSAAVVLGVFAGVVAVIAIGTGGEAA